MVERRKNLSSFEEVETMQGIVRFYEEISENSEVRNESEIERKVKFLKFLRLSGKPEPYFKKRKACRSREGWQNGMPISIRDLYTVWQWTFILDNGYFDKGGGREERRRKRTMEFAGYR